eukprot:TRINITY_DN3213_c0_g1_i4.p1 TRINITY_DN3213_c0_g1~~TRINITY_DN3213_c0_g1_i4.p1  ORF type:complete len:202 (+),score=12.13 TRINITY_DN3213_c0_g1_i4:200-805(+)
MAMTHGKTVQFFDEPAQHKDKLRVTTDRNQTFRDIIFDACGREYNVVSWTWTPPHDFEGPTVLPHYAVYPLDAAVPEEEELNPFDGSTNPHEVSALLCPVTISGEQTLPRDLSSPRRKSVSFAVVSHHVRSDRASLLEFWVRVSRHASVFKARDASGGWRICLGGAGHERGKLRRGRSEGTRAVYGGACCCCCLIPAGSTP